MKTMIDHLIEAHRKSGAPGTLTGWWGDGRYRVQLQSGEIKTFRFRTHGVGDDRVTVDCCWSIGGCAQRKRATSTK